MNAVILLAAVLIGQAQNPYPDTNTLPFAPPGAKVETRSVRYNNVHTGGRFVVVEELGYWKQDGFALQWVRVRPGKSPEPETHKRGDRVSISRPGMGKFFWLTKDPSLNEQLRQEIPLSTRKQLLKAGLYNEVDNGALATVLERKDGVTRVRLKDGREGWVHYDEVPRLPEKDQGKPETGGLPPEASEEIVKAIKAAKAVAGGANASVRKSVLAREKNKRLSAIAEKYKVTNRELAAYIDARNLDR